MVSDSSSATIQDRCHPVSSARGIQISYDPHAAAALNHVGLSLKRPADLTPTYAGNCSPALCSSNQRDEHTTWRRGGDWQND
jgi:hypothetical protein